MNNPGGAGDRAARERVEASVITPLAPGDAAIFETFVNARYLRHFGDLLLEMLSPPATPGDAVVAHLGCRTGYPERLVVERLGPTRLVGTDPSLSALELARAKAAAIPDFSADYRLFEGFPSPLPDASFTHALVLHPPGRAASRLHFVKDAARVLMPGGQLILGLPLRGSFVELADLLREYAVKYDQRSVQDAVDQAVALRPSPESLGEELEALGFVDVDVDFRAVSVPFQNGRDFLEDPTTRLLLLPEWQSNLGLDDAMIRTAFHYVRDAIDRYWAEGGFELSLHVGCARGFRG
ncbi:MAG: methyltransferase domain-containing protein [Myxococcales bacterium]|nr:methyltransferase domain-containing protein [Myxococcales bacterium]